MGYRSEVVLAVKGKAKEGIEELIRTNQEVRELFEIAEKVEIEGAVRYHWDEITWDEINDHVMAINEVLYDSDCDYDEFRFIRIGDDFNDVEIQGWMDEPFRLSLVREIKVTEKTEAEALL